MAGSQRAALQPLVFTRLTPDIEKRLLDHLDFPALMQFRATSRGALTLVNLVLHGEFRRILSHKVPQPVYLEAALARLDGYVGSHSALAFLLRSQLYKRFALELFLPRSTFDAMRRHMSDVQRAVSVFDKPVTHLPGVLRYSVWRTPMGRVGLYKSSSEYALLPIINSNSTAMMVYANSERFGAIWPTLTFRLRALPGPLFDGPSRSQQVLRDLGFTVRLYAWMWPDQGLPQDCAADRYLCPAQPRYVHDQGSLRGTWQPGTTALQSPRLCFRLDPRPCRGTCRLPHPHLEPLAVANEY